MKQLFITRKGALILTTFILNVVVKTSSSGLSIETTFDKVIGIMKLIGRYGLIAGIIATIFMGITGKGGDGGLKYGIYAVIGSVVITNIDKIADLLGQTGGVLF